MMKVYFEIKGEAYLSGNGEYYNGIKEVLERRLKQPDRDLLIDEVNVRLTP